MGLFGKSGSDGENKNMDPPHLAKNWRIRTLTPGYIHVVFRMPDDLARVDVQ